MDEAFAKREPPGTEKRNDLVERGASFAPTALVGDRVLQGASVRVLWFMYGDGSGAHVERVYTDTKRAKEDFALVEKVAHGSGEWRLDEVALVGGT